MRGQRGAVISYNGELYNFRSLRRELETSGVEFTSSGDTEVVLAAYERFGLDAFPRFRGMWALAVADPVRGRLVLSRDRFGVKPLYYAWRDGLFYFASEAKAILAVCPLERRLDHDAVIDYLSYRQPLGDATFIRGIRRLMPGHNLVVEGGEARLLRYWDLPVPEHHLDEDVNGTARLVREIVGESVEAHLVSDVPLGTYLSGGLDSSVLTYEVAQRSTSTVHTFTVGFNEEGYHEFDYAREVASSLGVEHNELRITAADYLGALEAVVRQKDAPLAVPNEVALHLLSRELKRTITVVLSGEGADELFGGYGRIFRSAEDLRKWALLDSAGLQEDERRSLADNLSGEYGARSADLVDHFIRRYSYISPEDKALLLGERFEDRTPATILRREWFEECFRPVWRLDPAEQYMHVFQRVHLMGLLERLDTTTMSFGVEARVPFVDHVVVETLQRLPLQHRIAWKNEAARFAGRSLTASAISEKLDIPKFALRTAYADALPASVTRREKVGFPVPLRSWFGSTALGATIRDQLLAPDARTRSLLSRQTLDDWFAELAHPRGRDRSQVLWMAYNLELWMSAYAISA